VLCRLKGDLRFTDVQHVFGGAKESSVALRAKQKCHGCAKQLHSEALRSHTKPDTIDVWCKLASSGGSAIVMGYVRLHRQPSPLLAEGSRVGRWQTAKESQARVCTEIWCGERYGRVRTRTVLPTWGRCMVQPRNLGASGRTTVSFESETSTDGIETNSRYTGGRSFGRIIRAFSSLSAHSPAAVAARAAATWVGFIAAAGQCLRSCQPSGSHPEPPRVTSQLRLMTVQEGERVVRCEGFEKEGEGGCEGSISPNLGPSSVRWRLLWIACICTAWARCRSGCNT